MEKYRQKKTYRTSDSKHRANAAQLDNLTERQIVFEALYRGLTAGMTPAASIATVNDVKIKPVASKIATDIDSGKTVTETLMKRRLGSHFDHSLVSIGETSGQLAKTTQFIAERYERIIKQKRLLKSKLRMPLFVGVLSIVVLPLPDFVAGTVAPWKYFSSVLFSASLFLIAWRFLKHIFRHYSNSINGYPAHLFIGIPWVDGVITDYSRASFVERLYLLFASGYPIIEAVERSHDSLVGFARRMRYQDLASDLHQGYSLPDTFEHHDILSPAQLSILTAGEAAGRLEDSLRHIADESRTIFEGKIQLFVTWFPRAAYAALALVITAKIL